MVRRVPAMAGNMAGQLDRQLVGGSIQSDGSMDSSSTSQLVVFVRVVFDDFSTKEDHCPKTTTREVPENTCITTASVTSRRYEQRLSALGT